MGEGEAPPCPKSLFYELMDFTFELSKIYNVLPFEIMKQDKDEVIMVLNYMAEKVDTVQHNKPPAVVKSDREESAAFWAAL